MVQVTGEDEPNILLDEVREMVNSMKKHKTPAKVLQALGENGIKAVWQLCSMIW